MSGASGRISRWASVSLAILFACSPKATPNVQHPVVSIPTENVRVLDAGGVASSSDNDSPVRIDGSDPMWGKQDALVTLVVFSDLQCPFCSRLETTFGKLKETFGPEKIRIVWKNVPLEFHENAKAAAEAAMGVFELAGPDAFWSFQSSAFANQVDLGAERYDLWAETSGVRDLDAFRKGRELGRWRPKVEADLTLAKSLGVVGTPHTYVNGIAIGGAQPFEKFKSVIDEELRKADLIVAAGGS
ncbi:MAG: thioredoxin domain-containing protein, partial [Polyangiaceae bacterium]|nr:thioredoxin domain-containing protein [Polyangiaceae bacterium]